MSFCKFFPITVIVSLLAVTMMALDIVFQKMFSFSLGDDSLLMLQTFIAFQAWAMYFMAGCTIKDAVRVFLGYVGGVLASIAIIALAIKVFSGLGAAMFLIPVFIVVIPVICAERVKMFDFVPAWFVGAGIYFATFTLYSKLAELAKTKALLAMEKAGATELPATFTEPTLMQLFIYTAVAVLLSCLWGLIYGWVTVFLRVKYEAAVKTEDTAAEEAAE